METKNQRQLPSPPTFSQMMEDLDIMASDDKIFKLFQLEQLADQAQRHENQPSSEDSVERTHWLINQFLAQLETLQRLDTSLTTQNDSTNDQLEKKLRDIIQQLQTCLTKLQTNSFSNTRKNVLTDNKK